MTHCYPRYMDAGASLIDLRYTTEHRIVTSNQSVGWGPAMATKHAETAQDIYQLKVTFLGTSPPIWHRFLVPEELTLTQLHNVLQTAMGSEDEHMHEFRASQWRSG